VTLNNLFENLPVAWPEEVYTLLLQQADIRIERIISQGQASPAGFWYDQAEHELVFLLQGSAQLQLTGEAVISLRPGDWLLIPAHARHRVVWTDPDQPSIWLAIFFPVNGQLQDPPLE
jgi:cupin 2 domain-containing protein